MSSTYESENFGREIDHVDIWFNDGTCDVIDKIKGASIQSHISFMDKIVDEYGNTIDNPKYSPETRVDLSVENGIWHPFKDEKNPYAEIAFLEKAAEIQQNVGWMAAMTALMLRIQRGFTVEELREYINKEQNEYNEWYRKRLNNELEMGSCRN